VYDAKAAFVVKPGHVTDGPEELRAALRRLLERGLRLTIHADTYIRSDDVVLALGRYALSGLRRDGTPVHVESGFADVLRRQPDGRWLIAVDNGFNSGLTPPS
jgi:ketosteroid isomerase-like protein